MKPIVGMSEIIDTFINPFETLSAVKVSRVVDENRKSEDWWRDYLADREPEEENEFYVLFADGMLVKKGRSKFKSSDYLKGNKITKFKTYYEQPTTT